MTAFIDADIPTLVSATRWIALSRMAGAYRTNEAGVFRSLTNREFIDFLEALQEMPWSWRNKAQGGVAVPLKVNAD